MDNVCGVVVPFVDGSKGHKNGCDSCNTNTQLFTGADGRSVFGHGAPKTGCRYD